MRRGIDGESSLDFRLLFESSPGLFLILRPDPEYMILGASNAYLSATLTEREKIVGRSLFEVFPDNPNDPAPSGTRNLRASLARVLSHKVSDTMAVQKYDIRRPDKDGGGFEERFWSPVNSPVFSETGDILYIIHRVEDVTEFVRLKQQGSEQQELTQALVNRAGMMEAEIYRRAQEVQEANQRLRELQGELEQRVEARTADLLQTNAKLEREIAERQRTAEALRKSEEQLRQAQKLEAIGRLAGGIAHDFNNLLTVILGHSQLLRTRARSQDEMASDLEEVEKAAIRAANLTRQLLAFSRQQMLQPRVLDLNEVVVDLDRMLRRLIGEEIDLLTVPAVNLGRVKIDPGQMEQVVVNLVVNARDAMPHGGKLTIETANVTLGESEVYGSEGLDPGHYVLLAVSDNGIGMDIETRARIFEPFFTTKDIGRGTGLGLSTVHGIVAQSGGHIDVYSEPGHGSTFKIYLPRVEAPIDVAKPPTESVQGLTGSETVLVVEDDELVRTVVSKTLRLNGYRVIEAKDRTEALKICEACRRNEMQLDLMLSDVVMPGMSIGELAERLKVLQPALRILYMSGYTDRAMTHQGLLETGGAFLQKPFTSDGLLSKLRELLENPRASAA